MTMQRERPCDHDDAVRRMARAVARGGSPDPALHEHVSRCAQCRETWAVATWMQTFACESVAMGQTPLPDPKYLWWKADLLRRWDAEQRTTQVIDTGEQVQAAIGLAAAVALLLWFWHGLSVLTSGSPTVTVAMVCGAALLAGAGAFLLRHVVVKE